MIRPHLASEQQQQQPPNSSGKLRRRRKKRVFFLNSNVYLKSALEILDTTEKSFWKEREKSSAALFLPVCVINTL
jgi:hypothetical protein